MLKTRTFPRLGFFGLLLLQSSLLTPSAFADDSYSQINGSQSIALDALWGQSSKFWKNVKSLRQSANSADIANEIFNNSHEKPSEGLGRLRLSYESVAPEPFDNYFNLGFFSMGYEHLAGGEILNRIDPQIKGYSIGAAELSFGLAYKALNKEGGWNYGFSNTLGIGRQYLVQGPVTDFLLEAPEQSATAFYWGWDFQLGYQNDFSNNLYMRHLFTLRPSYFYSAFDDPRYEFKIDSGSFHLRWRSESDVRATWGRNSHTGLEVGAQVISGQQPTPYVFLPRVWDSVHDLKTFPVLGNLVGLGTVVSAFTASRNLELEVVGGFYGGYLGAGAKLKIYHLELTAATFGVEQTPGFQVRESRIHYVGGGLVYDW